MIDYIKSTDLNNCSIDEIKQYLIKYSQGRKRIIAICDKCGTERNIRSDSYRSMCGSCSTKGRILSDETKKKISDSNKGKIISKETRDKISITVKKGWEEHPELHKDGIENQKGGQDLVRHHYIYDHSDLSKYTMLVTRSHHNTIHRLLRTTQIKIPHINIKDVL